MPVWVVSLQRSSDRRAAVAQNLEAQSLDFDFVDAVDGQEEVDWIQVLLSLLSSMLPPGYTLLLTYLCLISRRAEKPLLGCRCFSHSAATGGKALLLMTTTQWARWPPCLLSHLTQGPQRLLMIESGAAGRLAVTCPI